MRSAEKAAAGSRKVALALVLLECGELIEIPILFGICVAAAVAADP